MSPAMVDDETTSQALLLTGMESTLPSEEEQAQKKEHAFARLLAYVQLCGGKLEEGWACAVQCRLTTRRNGRLGVTTDNYYYSPSGQTFRSHKQVAEFLGLPEPQQPAATSSVTISHVTVGQSGQQPTSSTMQSAVSTNSHLSIRSNIVLKRPADRAAVNVSVQHTPKRRRAEPDTAAIRPSQARSQAKAAGTASNQTSVPSFDLSFAAQAARSAASYHAALAAQAALMGPVPAAAVPQAAVVANNAPVCSPQKQLPAEQQPAQDVQEPLPAAVEPVVQAAATAMAPPAPQQPAKRTKAMLAYKYTSSRNTVVASSSAAAAGPGSSTGSAYKPSRSSLGSSVTSSFNLGSSVEQVQQLVPALHQKQHKQQRAPHTTPAASASSSWCTASSAAAPTSTNCTASSPPRRQQQQQHHPKVYRTKELMPVWQQQPARPYKSKKQPAWRANLRMLASQFAANTASSGADAASVADTVSEQ